MPPASPARSPRGPTSATVQQALTRTARAGINLQSNILQTDTNAFGEVLDLHGGADRSVSKLHHSDRMVAALRRRKLRVEYVTPAAMGHGGPMPLAVLSGNVAFVAAALGPRRF